MQFEAVKPTDAGLIDLLLPQSIVLFARRGEKETPWSTFGTKAPQVEELCVCVCVCVCVDIVI